MRVAVIAEFYPRPRDPVLGVWAHRQASAAREAGADVRVVVLDRPLPTMAALRDGLRGRRERLSAELRSIAATPRTEVFDGIEVEYVRFLSPPRELTYASWHRFAARPLARALARGRPYDLVHAHYAHLAGAASLRFTEPRGIPLVVSVHGGDVLAPTLARPAARATIGRVLRTANGVVCNSARTLDLAAGLGGRRDHMRVVHLGTDLPEVLPPKREHPTIATLAHVIPRKRHEDVLRALERLPDDVRWLVIGDGPELPRLRSLVSEAGLEERVELAGQLPPGSALEQLATCHAMAMPSVDEAFGVAYVEALARGVPAVACRGEGGPEEIAALGDGMLLVPPGNPDALGEAIRRALEDPDLPRLARAQAREHFTWQACGEATVAAYEDALR